LEVISDKVELTATQINSLCTLRYFDTAELINKIVADHP